MSDGELSPDQKKLFSGAHEFFDVYIVTQGGAIRRTALPWNFWAYAVWLMHPHTDVEPEYFDQVACREADEARCGYAEALFNVVDRFLDENMSAKFLIDVRNDEKWKRCEKSFIAEQERREGVWREANNEFRKGLPPCLD
ncbi:hypothetical protein [Sphingomonas leidyi]|uniref:hypothetical protein n=1 Tax=Sphingomonas leidyi TaxID=68569 RepID=UPI0036D214C6